MVRSLTSKRHSSIPAIIIIAIIVVIAIYLLSPGKKSAVNGSKSPTKLPGATGSWKLSTCGKVEIDDVTIAPKKPNGNAKPLTRGTRHIQAAVFYPFGCRTKTSGCKYTGTNNAYPDPACTPGAIFDLSAYFTGRVNTDPAKYDQALNTAIICASSTSGRRNVPGATKNDVYAEYGVTHHTPATYEVDHVISLEIGGSNVIGNLGAEIEQPSHTAGKLEKDQAEGYLHTKLCSGDLTLRQVDTAITHGWLAYQK